MSIEQIDVDKVLAVLKHVAATAVNEEELRIKASTVLGARLFPSLVLRQEDTSTLLFQVGGLTLFMVM